LLKLPGINSKNVYAVMNRVESLTQLVRLSLAELTQVLGNSISAKQLHDFIHLNNQLPQTDANAPAAAVAAHSKVAAAASKLKQSKPKPALRKSPRKKK